MPVTRRKYVSENEAMLSASSLPVTGHGQLRDVEVRRQAAHRDGLGDARRGAAAIASSSATVAAQARSAGIEGPNERERGNPLLRS